MLAVSHLESAGELRRPFEGGIGSMKLSCGGACGSVSMTESIVGSSLTASLLDFLTIFWLLTPRSCSGVN